MLNKCLVDTGPFVHAPQLSLAWADTCDLMGSRWEHWTRAHPSFLHQPLEGTVLCSTGLNWLLLFFFFKYLFGCIGSQLWHTGYSIFVAAHGVFGCGMWTPSCSMRVLVFLTRNRTWATCIGNMEPATGPPGKSQLTSFGLHLYLHNLSSPGNLPLSWELNLLSPQASSVWLPPRVLEIRYPGHTLKLWTAESYFWTSS